MLVKTLKEPELEHLIESNFHTSEAWSRNSFFVCVCNFFFKSKIRRAISFRMLTGPKICFNLVTLLLFLTSSCKLFLCDTYVYLTSFF